MFLRGSETRHQTSLILAHGNGTTAVCHATNPGNLCKSQNPESEGHGNPQRWRGNLSSSVKHGPVASVSFTTGMKRYKGVACSPLLKAGPTFLGKPIVCDEGQYEEGAHSHLTWGPQRATNHLDQIPRSQDGSESYFFRHGHQGLLSVQPPSPMPSSTTQTDSYQPPRNVCQPLRGVKHERPTSRQPKKKKRDRTFWWDCGLFGGPKGKPQDSPSSQPVPEAAS